LLLNKVLVILSKVISNHSLVQDRFSIDVSIQIGAINFLSSIENSF